MTNEQILKKAIDKAVKNGWDWKPFLPAFPKLRSNLNMYKLLYIIRHQFIFSHDFAKALWGEKVLLRPNAHGFDCQLEWAYHLQEMVLEDDKLKYIEKHL